MKKSTMKTTTKILKRTIPIRAILLALHNTILAGNRRFQDFLGVREILYNELEPLWVTRINNSYVVMQGIGKFLIANDEQFAVIIKSESTATRFETTAIHEKRQVISGWALESGKGRIAGLLPGHTNRCVSVPGIPEYHLARRSLGNET